MKGYLFSPKAIKEMEATVKHLLKGKWFWNGLWICSGACALVTLLSMLKGLVSGKHISFIQTMILAAGFGHVPVAFLGLVLISCVIGLGKEAEERTDDKEEESGVRRAKHLIRTVVTFLLGCFMVYVPLFLQMKAAELFEGLNLEWFAPDRVKKLLGELPFDGVHFARMPLVSVFLEDAYTYFNIYLWLFTVTCVLIGVALGRFGKRLGKRGWLLCLVPVLLTQVLWLLGEWSEVLFGRYWCFSLFEYLTPFGNQAVNWLGFTILLLAFGLAVVFDMIIKMKRKR